MPAGLQIFNESGGIVFDITDVSARVLGTRIIAANSGTGSLTDSRLATGKPFVAMMGTILSWPLVVRGTCSTSGNTVNWKAGEAEEILVYGVM